MFKFEKLQGFRFFNIGNFTSRPEDHQFEGISIQISDSYISLTLSIHNCFLCQDKATDVIGKYCSQLEVGFFLIFTADIHYNLTLKELWRITNQSFNLYSSEISKFGISEGIL
jgi:hypothetical protein